MSILHCNNDTNIFGITIMNTNNVHTVWNYYYMYYVNYHYKPEFQNILICISGRQQHQVDVPADGKSGRAEQVDGTSLQTCWSGPFCWHLVTIEQSKMTLLPSYRLISRGDQESRINGHINYLDGSNLVVLRNHNGSGGGSSRRTLS